MKELPQARPDASPVTVALIVWAIVVLLLGAGVFGRGELFLDTDDYMRAVQVREWLAGAGWFDLHQERLNPPLGVDMHWARLPDLPLAAATLLLRPFLGDAAALMGAGVIVPPLLLLALLATMAWAARPLLAAGREPLAILVTVFAVCVAIQYAPGRIDHHNWQLLLTALGSGACLRLMHDPARRAPAVVSGVSIALGSWIGVESLIGLTAASAALVVRWIWTGDRTREAGLLSSAALLAASLLLLPVAVPPGRYFAVACDAFSFASVVLAGAAVLFWGMLRLVGGHTATKAARLALCGLSAGVCVGLLFIALPECRGGPLAGIDPVLARVWLSRVSEAQPLYAILVNSPERIPLLVGLPLLALIVAVWRATRERGTATWMWWTLAIHLVLGLALTAWQVRVAPFANLFAIPALAWMAGRAWDLVEENWQDWRQPVGRVATLLLLVSVPWLGLLAAPAQSDSAASGNGADEDSCRLAGLAAVTPGPNGGPATIAASIDLGPKILFQTTHRVLAAPYHRNNAGNLDAYHLLTAATDEEARTIVDRRAVDYMLLCPGSRETKDYAGSGNFTARLTAGTVPDWLQPVTFPDEPKALLYTVVRKP